MVLEPARPSLSPSRCKPLESRWSNGPVDQERGLWDAASMPSKPPRSGVLVIVLAFLSAGLGGVTERELELTTRRLVPVPDGKWQTQESRIRWLAPHTAAVVCDMWDRHWCAGATARVAEMAPRMNDLLKEIRSRGVLIIHCPSDMCRSFYWQRPGDVAHREILVSDSDQRPSAGRQAFPVL